MCLSTSQPPFQVTHVLDPVDLKGGLGRGFTGHGHGTTRSYCSTFWLYHQLDLQRHRLWGWGHEVESYTSVWPLWPWALTLPSLRARHSGPPHLHSPQTVSWMGAVYRARRRGRPGLKLQEKVGWGAPPRAGVTVSSDWSVKSPVAGCLLVSSCTDTPMAGRRGEDKARNPRVDVGGVRKKAAKRGDFGAYLCHQV